MAHSRSAHLTPATLAHASWLGQNLRPEDAAELRAWGRTDLQGVVEEGFRLSEEAFTGHLGDRVVAMAGVVATPMGGCVWLLGAPGLERLAVQLHKEAKAKIASWLPRHGRLFNTCWAPNTVHVRWLRRLGFTLHPPQGDFIAFEMTHV
jgi:hypothetical protein